MMIVVWLLIILPFNNAKFAKVYTDYPKSILVFEDRIDHYSGKPVVTGLAHKLKNRVTLAEFKRHMQCVEVEPNFDYNGGSASLIRNMPPTRETVELIAVSKETGCNVWRNCQKLVEQFKNDSSIMKPRLNEGGFDGYYLFRVIKGEFYYDWPWGIERFNTTDKVSEGGYTHMFSNVLDAISDMKDSVFLIGDEQPSLGFNVPFPLFSSAPRMGKIDMPFPWYEGIKAAQNTYKEILKQNLPFTDASVNKVHHHRSNSWDERLSKAAFFANYDKFREDLFDCGRRRPDLFDIAFSMNECIEPWNPLSPEDCLNRGDPGLNNSGNTSLLPAGFATPLLDKKYEDRPYHPSHYKYVIVPMGLDGRSTTGRLAGLLSHSGSVILLLKSPFVYHFSAQFKPWIHYVPLSFGGADVIEKVEWLRDHDDLARQIATNGRAFARSYLRLEDYYCYTAAALEMVAELEEGTNVTVPFNPVKLTGRRNDLIDPIIIK